MAANKCLTFKVGSSGYYTASFSYFGKQHFVLEHVLIVFKRDGILYDNVDHIDGDILNNSPDNLRGCSFSENSQNRKVPSTNSSGEKNVHFVPNKSLWRVSIVAFGKRYVKHFKRFEDAVEHAKTKRAELHGNFSK